MMLTDPGGVQTHFFCVHRLVNNAGDELVGAPDIVVVVIIAQREIAEFDFSMFAGYRIPPLGDIVGPLGRAAMRKTVKARENMS